MADAEACRAAVDGKGGLRECVRKTLDLPAPSGREAQPDGAGQEKTPPAAGTS